MYRLLALLLSTLLFVLCAPCRQIESTHRDSLSIEIRPRTVTIRDTLLIEIPQSSQSITIHQDSSLLENQYSRSEAKILPSGELSHSLENLSQSLKKEFDMVVEVRDSIIYRKETEVKTIEVERELSMWQKLQIKGFWGLFSIIFGAIMIRRLIG